jgi:hypothetical protein
MGYPAHPINGIVGWRRNNENCNDPEASSVRAESRSGSSMSIRSGKGVVGARCGVEKFCDRICQRGNLLGAPKASRRERLDDHVCDGFSPGRNRVDPEIGLGHGVSLLVMCRMFDPGDWLGFRP